eukprot:1351139-Amorphochlora_amoeboformis.AAC.1
MACLRRLGELTTLAGEARDATLLARGRKDLAFLRAATAATGADFAGIAERESRPTAGGLGEEGSANGKVPPGSLDGRVGGEERDVTAVFKAALGMACFLASSELLSAAFTSAAMRNSVLGTDELLDNVYSSVVDAASVGVIVLLGSRGFATAAPMST